MAGVKSAYKELGLNSHTAVFGEKAKEPSCRLGLFGKQFKKRYKGGKMVKKSTKGKTTVRVGVVDPKTGKIKRLKGLSRKLTEDMNKDKSNKPEKSGELENAKGETICSVCGIVATLPSEFCEHLKAKYEKENKGEIWEPGKQPELPGMPPKTEECIIAEDILDLKDHISNEREKLDTMKRKLVSEMRRLQKSHLLVKGWDFGVELEDKLKITKKRT